MGLKRDASGGIALGIFKLGQKLLGGAVSIAGDQLLGDVLTWHRPGFAPP
jgi:hypothetical protein